jgi:hypothetical protein
VATSRGRLLVVLAAATLAMLVPAVESTAHPAAPMWSLADVMRRIDGARVSIGRWTHRVQSASTLCSGEGRGERWSGTRHWRHFLCTWTVFDSRGGVDRDVTFRVHSLTRTSFVITDARFGSE